jgi:hypothetical protein
VKTHGIDGIEHALLLVECIHLGWKKTSFLPEVKTGILQLFP